VQVYCNYIMKLQAQTLRSRRNAAHGWNDVLFSALEDGPNGPHTTRVDKVLGLLVAADAHRREWMRLLSLGDKSSSVDGFLELNRKMRESETAYHQTLEELNVALRRYRWGANVQGDINGFRSYLEPLAVEEGSWSYWESFIVAELLQCANEPGGVSRFRRCSECQNWFLRRTEHQHFCDESCRRSHAAQDPGFKEKRRTYMRERYRPLQKELQKRSLALAKGKRTKDGKE
jgi:hypothetical protein